MTTTDSKTQNTSSAAPHNPFAAFDPMAMWNTWTNAQQTFMKMMGDTSTRTQTWSDEVASMEAQMLARANAAIDTWAQLARDTISYTAQLSAQARNLGMDAARKASANVAATVEATRKATGA